MIEFRSSVWLRMSVSLIEMGQPENSGYCELSGTPGQGDATTRNGTACLTMESPSTGNVKA